MCQSKADGGKRCPSTSTGRALNVLYRDRRDNPRRAKALTGRIEQVKDAVKFYGGRFVTPHELPLEHGVEVALEALREVGNPLVVGGMVRDSMLGEDSKDTDIEVYGADIDTIASRMRKKGFQVDEVGKAFGVLKVSKKGVVSDLDVAVPRRENAVGKGHRDFMVESDADMTVTDAAERRDFTINAMMYDPARKMLVDPFNGDKDMRIRTLRHVSDKFSEDPLRVLRGFQFAGRFGMKLAPETAALCRGLRDSYDELSVERVREEWSKFFTKSVRPDLGISALQDAGWDDTSPGLREALVDPAVKERLALLTTVNREDRSVMGAALIASKMSDADRTGFLSTVLISKDESRLAKDLASADAADMRTPYARKVVARKLASHGFTYALLERFAEWSENAALLNVAHAGMSEGMSDGPETDFVQGRDVLKTVNRKPGPWLGKLLEDARERQYRGEFADAEAAVSWARSEASSTS